MLTDDAIVTLPNDKPRCCKIDSASIEDEQGRGSADEHERLTAFLKDIESGKIAASAW